MWLNNNIKIDINTTDFRLKIEIQKANMYNIDKLMIQTQLIQTEIFMWHTVFP